MEEVVLSSFHQMKKTLLALVFIIAFAWWLSTRFFLAWIFWPETPVVQVPQAAQSPIQARAATIASEIAQAAAKDPAKPHVLIGLGGPSATTEIILALKPHRDWPAGEERHIAATVEGAIGRGIAWFRLITLRPGQSDAIVEL